MSTRLVHDCDRCKAKEPVAITKIEVVVGRSCDPAGGPSENDYETIDLCAKCAGELLCSAVKGLDYKAAKKWIDDARKGKS